jgi:hypothetical protein
MIRYIVPFQLVPQKFLGSEIYVAGAISFLHATGRSCNNVQATRYAKVLTLQFLDQYIGRGYLLTIYICGVKGSA